MQGQGIDVLVMYYFKYEKVYGTARPCFSDVLIINLSSHIRGDPDESFASTEYGEW
jgi:hypothetical protein